MIKEVRAREVIDSRGNPTVEAVLKTRDGVFSEIVPSGASTGVHEALELRDGGKRYGGQGVLKAVRNVNGPINRVVNGLDCRDQRKIDEAMIKLDGTPNKSRLGANAMLAVSLAACRAASPDVYSHIAELSRSKMMIPVPFMNIINGGKHAGGTIDFQEFMIVPMGKDFTDSLLIGTEVYHLLKAELKRKYGPSAINVGDEGGFAPQIKVSGKISDIAAEPLRLLSEAIDDSGHSKKVKFAMDAAASSFYKNNRYVFAGRKLSPHNMLEVYESMAEEFPLISIEDPFQEEDYASFAELRQCLRGKVQVVGDDLTVTNTARIQRGIDYDACSALLLKVNQIGTLSEAIDASILAKAAGWNIMVSHRSGETESTFIADLAVGLGTGQIKSGAPCRGERTAKYNRLLRIEEALGKKARMPKQGFWRV